MHPNAKASFVTTLLAALVLHGAQRYGHVDISPEDALGIAGVGITSVLFVGRRGLWPTIRAVVLGGRNAVAGAKAPEPTSDETT